MQTTNERGLVARNQYGIVVDNDLANQFKRAKEKKDSIEDFVNDFLGDYISPCTKRAYLKDLQLFFDFLKSGGEHITHPSQIESVHFKAYRDRQQTRGLSSATIARRLVAIRSFIQWSIARNLMDRNPLDSVKLPKVQTEAPTLAFEDHEALSMIMAADISTYKGRMNRLIMVLLFNLGLRRSELANIRMEDIVEERGHKVLRVKGKGGKIRQVPLRNFVLNEIKDYEAHLASAGQVLWAGDLLIQTEEYKKNETPIDGSTIYRIVARHAKQLGIDKRVSPHSCRATVISHLLDTKEKSMRDVADFAGHTNINTTERYDKRRNNLDKSAAYDVGFGADKIKGRTGRAS